MDTEVQREPTKVPDWIRTTSTKFLKIGAGLREFLRWTEKIVFTAEPSHEPDPQFVEELRALLHKIDAEHPSTYSAKANKTD